MSEPNEIRNNSQPELNAAELGLHRQEREHLLTQKHRKKSLMSQRIQNPAQERVVENKEDDTDNMITKPIVVPPNYKLEPPISNHTKDNKNCFMFLNIGVIIGFLFGVLVMFFVQIKKQSVR